MGPCGGPRIQDAATAGARSTAQSGSPSAAVRQPVWSHAAGAQHGPLPSIRRPARCSSKPVALDQTASNLLLIVLALCGAEQNHFEAYSLCKCIDIRMLYDSPVMVPGSETVCARVCLCTSVYAWGGKGRGRVNVDSSSALLLPVGTDSAW